MDAKFKTAEEEQAYKQGQIDGMLRHINHTIKNLKLEYEKLYQKKLESEK